jgi:hypothetical protein
MRIARRFRAGGGEKLAGRPFLNGGLVGSDLACQYDVIPPTPVSADGVAQYGVLNWVAQSYDGSNAVQAYVSQSLGAQFAVLGTESPVFRVARRMRSPVTLRKIVVATSAPARPALELVSAYNIGGLVIRDLATTYQVAPSGPGDTWMVGDPFVTAIAAIGASGSVSITDLSLSAVNRDQLGIYNLFGALGGFGGTGAAAIAPTFASGSVALSSAQLTASADRSAQYSVIQQAFATLTGSASILMPVQSDGVGSYSLTGLEPVSEDLVGEYRVYSVVNKNLTSAYQVLMTVSRAANFDYTVLSPNAVNADMLGTYSVGGWVQRDEVFAWDSGGWVRADLLSSFRVGDLSASPARMVPIDLMASMTHAGSVSELQPFNSPAAMSAYRA